MTTQFGDRPVRLRRLWFIPLLLSVHPLFAADSTPLPGAIVHSGNLAIPATEMPDVVVFGRESSLIGEAAPVADIHLHPAEPRQFRLGITRRF